MTITGEDSRVNSVPFPVWTHGIDPEGAEFYSCPDPTDPTMRVTVTSMAIYDRNRWHVDYVSVNGWWWMREHRFSLPHGATAQEGMREAVFFLYGDRQRIAAWVWRTVIEQGLVDSG